jgi:hypothetical protein
MAAEASWALVAAASSRSSRPAGRRMGTKSLRPVASSGHGSAGRPKSQPWP